MNKSALVNGANSLIGYALTKKLLNNGYFVHALVRKSSNIDHLKNLTSSITFHYYELEDYDQFDPSFNVDIFFHLAWKGTDKLKREDPTIQFENIDYSLSAVRLAKRLGATTFVGIGSQAEFAESLTPYNDDTRIDPNTYYGIAKFAAGKASKLLCTALEMRHVWIRVFSVYGPYDKQTTLISLIIRCIQYNSLLQLSDGNQIWDFLHSDDAGEAIYQLALYGHHGKSYSLGSGIGIKIKDYIHIIQNIDGINLQVMYNEDSRKYKSRSYLVSDNTDMNNAIKINFVYDFESGFMNTYYHQINSKLVNHRK